MQNKVPKRYILCTPKNYDIYRSNQRKTKEKRNKTRGLLLCIQQMLIAITKLAQFLQLRLYWSILGC